MKRHPLPGFLSTLFLQVIVNEKALGSIHTLQQVRGCIQQSGTGRWVPKSDLFRARTTLRISSMCEDLRGNLNPVNIRDPRYGGPCLLKSHFGNGNNAC